METLGSNFEYRQILGTANRTRFYGNTVKYPRYRQILGTANRTRFYGNTVKCNRRPSATVGNHMGTHQVPLDTFGNPEYSDYLLFKRFLRRTRSSNKRWRPQTICSRASVLFIRTNTAKIQIYRQLLLATQIPSNTQIFDGIWVANIKYRILSNTAKYYMGSSQKTKTKTISSTHHNADGVTSSTNDFFFLNFFFTKLSATWSDFTTSLICG